MKMTDEMLKRQVINQLAEKNACMVHFSTADVLMRVNNYAANKRATQIRTGIASISATLALIILGAFFLLTPSGHAAAKDILSFFAQLSGNERPQTIIVDHQNELPNIAENASSAVAVPQTIVLDDFVYNLTPDQAEEKAGFPLISDEVLPDGYVLNKVIFNQKKVDVIRLYLWNGMGGTDGIVLSQQLVPEKMPIGKSSDVTFYQVGGILVEGVQGGWLETANAKVESWIPGSPMYTYRWQQNGYLFTLQFVFNEVTDPGYLAEDARLQVIGLLTGSENATPKRWNLNNLTLEDSIEVAEFPVLVPSQPIKGMIFDRAIYEVEVPRLVLLYEPGSTELQMRIFEIPIELSTGDDEYTGLPTNAVQKVNVGSSPATFIRGAMINGIYDPNFSLSLVWKTDTTFIHITVLSADSGTSPSIAIEDLIALAESMH